MSGTKPLPRLPLRFERFPDKWQARLRMKSTVQKACERRHVDTVPSVMRRKPTTFQKLELGLKYGSLTVALLGGVTGILTLCLKEKTPSPPAPPIINNIFNLGGGSVTIVRGTP
jgi:hypothetical protein